jgi:predicted Zn-dependent peptidase
MVKDPDYKLDILNNGLKVITTKMDYINTISIHILVKVGLWDQDIISSNKAHFIEHIIACEIIENIVAKNILLYDYNASTYNEKTEYYINCLSNNFNIVLNKILDILNKIFNNYKIKKKIFEREKLAIMKEHINDMLSEENTIMTNLLKFLFPKSYLHVDDKLLLENTKKIKISDLENFLKEYYIPGNIIISIAGNFKSKSNIIKSIKDKFCNIDKKKYSNDLLPVKINYKYEYKRMILPKYNNESKLIISFYIGNYKDLDEKARFTIDIITKLLNLSIGYNETFSLLYRLRNKNKYVYYTNSELYLGKYSIFQIITEGIDNKLIKKVINEIVNILNNFKNNLIPKDKLKKYIYDKEKLDESFSKRYISSSFYSEFYGDLILNDEKNYLGNELSYLKKIKPTDIRNISKIIFVKDNCKILLIGKYNRLININL